MSSLSIAMPLVLTTCSSFVGHTRVSTNRENHSNNNLRWCSHDCFYNHNVYSHYFYAHYFYDHPSRTL